MSKDESSPSGNDLPSADLEGRVRGTPRTPAEDLPHHELVDLATWLSSKSVVVRVAMVTQGLELSLGAAANDDQRRMSIDVSQGQLVVESSVQDLERVIGLVVQERARAQGVVIKSVSLRLNAVQPRQMEWFLTVSAKQGFLSATVEIQGRVTIDDTFHARVSGVEVRGQGMLGGVVALWLRPQMKQIEQEEYHVSSLLPGNLRIEDVRMEVDQQLRIIAVLAGSSVHLPKPGGGDAATTKPLAATSKSAANQRSALAAPRKLDIYVIDTGGNEKATAVLDSHLTLFEAFLADQNICFLSVTQSQHVLRQNPALVGADPILMVVDSDRRADGAAKGYGYRFCLGSLTQDQASTAAVERLLRIVAEGARGSAETMVERLTTEMRLEGHDGAMQLVVDVVEGVERR